MSEVQVARLPHTTTKPLASDHIISPENNWLEHLAPVSIGVFYFGSLFPKQEENAYARQALFKTSFLFRHFLHPMGLRVHMVNQTAYLTGELSADVVVIMGEILAKQIRGIEGVCNETTKVMDDAYSVRRFKAPVHAEADQELRIRMQLLLATDATLAPSSLSVEVRDGKMTITGLVPSDEVLDWIEQLCQELEGAGRVDLRIRVSSDAAIHDALPKTPIDDDSIQALIQTRLRLLKSTRSLKLDVHSHKQHVRLSGDAFHREVESLAEKVASTTFGVHHLTTQLRVF